MISLLSAGCVPTWDHELREADTSVPERYPGSPGVASVSTAQAPEEELNSGELKAREFFSDPHLIALIDAAVEHNQELNIAALEILAAKSEVLARRGEYLPRAKLRAGGKVYQEGDNETQFEEEERSGEYVLGLFASWEIDIWRKLRNARSAAAKRYMASIEGKRFLVTSVVAEVAETYYELMTLDNLLLVLKENIEIQRQALEVVRLQKTAGRVTELAVKRFEAEVLKNRSRQFYVQQKVTEAENRINLLAGRFRQPIARSSRGFMEQAPSVLRPGAPSELLGNRPDVRQAELALQAAKLDVEVAKARFYPSLELSAGVAIEEIFHLAKFPSSPIAIAYSLGAELVQPLWNRNGLTADYFVANSMQLQAVFSYERAVLGAYTEVSNQLARIDNLAQSYALRLQEVERLNESIEISSSLFRSARADYMEVLLTRRDALDSRMELIETKGRQFSARVKLYRALGGGWR